MTVLDTIDIGALQRLAAPFFDEGAAVVYVAAAENRIRVGTEPAAKVRGNTNVTPRNVQVTSNDDEAWRKALVELRGNR